MNIYFGNVSLVHIIQIRLVLTGRVKEEPCTLMTQINMHAHHIEPDENGLAIQKKFQVCGQSFQPIQCFLGPLMYPF